MARNKSRRGTAKPKVRIVDAAKGVNSVDGLNQYVYSDKKRPYNPPVGLVTAETDKEMPKTKYAFDPYLDPALDFDGKNARDRLVDILDSGIAAATLEEAKASLESLKKAQEPYLNWSGKAEHTSFDIDTVSLHVHERIDPLTIMEKVVKKEKGPLQMSLFPYFESSENNPPLREAIDFYKHSQNWSNRLVAGDSLLVMNSLLEKESMAGKVQMIYIDPPYGVKYGSNFQPFVNKRNVTDGKDADLTQEPETVTAYRDTWELGIHSYLTYLRDRLMLSRDLLSVSGSIFVQISDENVHHVKELLDEVFGSKNFVSLITFRKTSGAGSISGKTTTLATVADYLLWYAKDKDNLKYRQLYLPKLFGEEGASMYTWLQLPDGSRRRMTTEERENPKKWPAGARAFGAGDLTSFSGVDTTRYVVDFEGKKYTPHPHVWKTSKAGMDRLKAANRILASGSLLYYVRYIDDFQFRPISNLWDDTTSSFMADKVYAVQTNTKVIERCVLMTTDPGDLVFDPTCGSGTTAFAAEHWGRRWVTCDTSRVAITLARQRLMTSVFKYYRLAHPTEGVSSGFEYKTAQHLTLKSVANAERPGQEVLYDQPEVDASKRRVSGPFTVEAVPSQRVLSTEDDDSVNRKQEPDSSIARSGESIRTTDWISELQATGIRAKSGQRIEFARLEPLAAASYLHADGETKESEPKRIVISFGSAYSPLGKEQVERAIEEAQKLIPKPRIIVFASFQFDPEAAKDIDETNWPGVTLLKSQMNTDLFTSDLKKARSSNESFWLVGQPDVELEKTGRNGYVVKVNGFDYYNPVNGEIESGDISRIAMWMLDPDYDGRSLYPREIFFPMAGKNDGWAKLGQSLRAELDEDILDKLYKGNTSLSFELGDKQRVAVKIIDDRGIESLKIVEAKE